MTREQALDDARTAARRAAVLASHAEGAAHNRDRHHEAAPFAAAGALWADVARAHAAIAAAIPEPQPEEMPNTDTEATDA